MAWLTGYAYRKSITLSRASGIVNNYQMKLLLGESSGATGESVDCGGHCLSTFDDIRFTTSDETTLLDYYIETVSGVSPNQLATIWIEFDTIGTTDTTFYMYYGKANAIAYSNGTNTFVQFEDFEWGTDEDNVDTSGGSVTWNKSVAGTSTAKIDTGQFYTGNKSLRLYRDGTNSLSAYFSQVAGSAYAISWMMRKDGTASAYVYHGDGSNYIKLNAWTNEVIYINGSTTARSCLATTWQKYELTELNFSTKVVDIWLEGEKIKDNGAMTVGASDHDTIEFYSAEGTNNIWIDNVIVRQWVAVEPVWGAWGAESSFILTTQSVSDVTTTTCTANGTIVSTGISDVTVRGFAYKVGTSGDPTVADFEVHEDGDFPTESYSLPITGLTENTGYRVAAYGTNTEGTFYGNTVQLTTQPIVTPTVTTQEVSSVTEMTATGNGTITSDGEGVTTERGICLKVGSGQTPTVSDTKFHDHTDAIGAFTVSITGLTAGVTYSYRAYAINSKGNGYGDVLEFTTNILKVTTQEILNPRETSSTANGTITALGDHNVDVRGFCWVVGMGVDPLITDNIVHTDVGGYGLGAYSIEITGIPIGESYKVRAYATDAHRTVYGNVIIKRNMLRARLSLNIVNKHLSIKIANSNGNVLALDKIRLLFNNKNERNNTIPMNINSHHFSVKFTNSSILKQVSFNIETLGAR